MVACAYTYILLLSCVLASAETARPRRFGHEWVRTHPFTLMALVQRPETLKPDEYRGAGLNTVLAWKGRGGIFQTAIKSGLPWFYHVSRPLDRKDRQNQPADELKQRARRFCETYAGCQGFILWDEPARTEFQKLGELVASFQQTFPYSLIYSNVYPLGAPIGKYYGGKWMSSAVYETPPVPYTYDDYLREFLQTVKPDVLMFDTYPFPQPPEADPEVYLATKYFRNLESVRRAGLNADVPYWTFVQAYEREGGGGRRLPSESDLRMQLFSSLAYGFTGIAYFTYEAAFMRGLLEKDGSPSRLYHDAANANKEIHALGQALRFLRSTGVWHAGGQHRRNNKLMDDATPEGMRAFDASAVPNSPITKIRLGDKPSGKGALIGFFEDDGGGRYFVLVNLQQAANTRADDLKLTVALSLAPSVRRVTRLSRKTGTGEQLRVTDATLHVTLPGGTGDLFKVGPGLFPGLPGAR